MVQEAKPDEGTPTPVNSEPARVPVGSQEPTAPVESQQAGVPPAPQSSGAVQPEVILPGTLEIRFMIKRDFLERARKVAAYAVSVKVIDGDERADNFPAWVAYCLLVGEEMMHAQYKKATQNGSTA